MSHKNITEMTQEEMNAYIEELRPHLEALAKGEQYMLDALADAAGAIVAEAPQSDLNDYVPIAPLIADSYPIDPNGLTISAVLDMSADGEKPADD